MDNGEEELRFHAAATASRSNDLVGKVHAYGEAHPDVVVHVRVDEGPPARLVVMLWGDDVAEHQDALLELRDAGEVLEFETARWSLAQLEDIRTAINAMTDRSPGAVKGSGPSDGVMRLDLRADQESLAADLHQRYGEAVSLSVGLFPYPLGRDLTRTERLTRAGRERVRPPVTRVSIPGISARLELFTPVLRPGEDGRARIVVANDGPGPVHLHTDQPLTAWIADTSSGEPVGGFTGFMAGTGWQLSLKPGESGDIQVVFGTASRRADMGYALPPGPYQVQTEVPLHNFPTGTERGRQVLSVSGAPLIIEAPSD